MIKKEDILAYKQKAWEDGLPRSEFQSLAPRNNSLSRQQATEPIMLLKPIGTIEGDPEESPSKMKAEDGKLRKAMTRFRSLWDDQSPFPYLSKFAFAEKLLTSTPRLELLLRFLTDRSFYFEQYRKLGDYPGEERKHPSAPNIISCFDDEDFWRIYEATPAELLKQGLKQAKGEFD